MTDGPLRGPVTAALTIAGSDSSGGAGVQADLQTFAAHGIYGLSAVTAVTAQDASGVRACHPVPPAIVEAQIAAALAGPGVAAVKTGMLATAAIVDAVASAAARLPLPRLVVDPVLRSGHGDRLLDDDAVALLVRALLPRAAVVTPNRAEAERLAGIRIASPEDARDAARRIHDLGPGTVVVTGGHLEEDAEHVVDVIFDGHDLTEPRVARVPGPTVHGTGCTFAAAVTAGLASGLTPVEAAEAAQRFVAGAMRHAITAGPAGRALDPFWRVVQRVS
ncbi:MAG: bifunctional hydroxymethylpyrimidine kinase/phosphomethylpyrimidine kinase [Acidobacteria bacterium]|nr:bifunctional hydroxymethylpyrimidine kinase/phosphomethylpyrimidine kinase [Acidobacteriota bacterium]